MTRFYSAVSIAAFFLCTFPTSVLSQPAPTFSLPSENNQTISLDSLKGKVVYLDFWASWCTPCRKSFPWMNELQSRYDKNKFTVVAINLDSSRKEAESFLAKMPAKFKVAYDPEGEVASKYNLRAMPSSFIIDSKGELVFAHKGYREKEAEEIESKIRTLLK